MQLTCSHCALIFTTNHLDKEKGLADISNQFSTHFNQKHQSEAKQMALDLRNLNMIAVWLVLMSKHTTLLDMSPEEQITNPIMEKFTEVVDEIEGILGIEVTDIKPEERKDVDTETSQVLGTGVKPLGLVELP